MSNILVINSSAAGRDSVSRVLVADAVSKLLEVNPHAKVTHRDLGENPPPHLISQTPERRARRGRHRRRVRGSSLVR